MNLRWEKISEQRIQINRWRAMTKKRFRLPHGHVGDFYTWAGHTIICALVVTTDGKVVLAKQFRPGPERVMFELPGGGVEPGETPRRAVVREVLEETGYKGRVRFLGKTSNDGWRNHPRYHFLITQARQATGPIPEVTEAIEVVTVSVPVLMRMVRMNQLTDFETAIRGLEELGRISLRTRPAK